MIILLMPGYFVVGQMQPVDKIPSQVLCLVEKVWSGDGIGQGNIGVVVQKLEKVAAVAVEGVCHDVWSRLGGWSMERHTA